MKLFLTVVVLAVAMCFIMWDSVVYTAAPPPSHDGPHPPGKPGGPACRGQGSRPRNATTNSTG